MIGQRVGLIALLLFLLASPAAAGVLTARPGVPSRGDDAARGFRRLDQAGMARAGTLYVPSGYDPARPAPLVVLLHGAGGDPRRAVDGVKQQAEAHGTIVLAPASGAATWDLVARRRFGADARMLDALLREVFARYAVDPARVAIAGFSDGGSYALSLGMSNGDLFGRVVAFSPGFALPVRQAGRPAVFISHGTADTVLPIEATGRRTAKLLEKAGYEVRYREFDGGHAVPPAIAAEAFAWLAERAPSPNGEPAPIPLADAEPAGDEPLLEQLLWPLRDREVGRWLDPVCPRVVGAASTFVDQIEAQFYAVAAQVGVAMAARPCRASLTIDFVRSPGARPATARYRTRPATAARIGIAAAPRVLRSATITIDKARAEAVPIEALGAYIALVGFAELGSTTPAPTSTLLALFDDPAAPQRLTTRDLEFLRRLYGPSLIGDSRQDLAGETKASAPTLR